jgi:anti-anti-sigma factor
MKINFYIKNRYQVIRIEEDLQIISELSELRYLIEGYIKQDKNYIAVCFSDSSYIYSGAIAILIDCFKQIRNRGGDLCIIEPNSDMLSVLTLLNINRMVTIYHSEDDLPQ